MALQEIMHKYIYKFFGNTTYPHESVVHSHNIQRHCPHCRVQCKQNENHHAKCIQITVKPPVSVQVWKAIYRREKLGEQ